MAKISARGDREARRWRREQDEELREQMAAEERLTRIENDGNLRHSGARWRAHIAVHGESVGARGMEANYAERDAEQIVEVEACLAEFRAADADASDIEYLEWLLVELRGTG